MCVRVATADRRELWEVRMGGGREGWEVSERGINSR